MAKMDVEIPEALREWVESRVETGLYTDASDYIRELIRHEVNAAGDAARRDELETMIAEGMADIEAGRVHDAEEVFAELEAKYAAMEEPISTRRKAG